MEIPTNSQIILNQIVAKPSMYSWDALMDFISTETNKYISDKKKSYGPNFYHLDSNLLIQQQLFCSC